MQMGGIIGHSYLPTNFSKCEMKGLCFIGNLSMKHKPFTINAICICENRNMFTIYFRKPCGHMNFGGAKE